MDPVLKQLPAILDIYVVWHPDDKEGELVCEKLIEHYHSQSFAGLVGGAIEVYPRSQQEDPASSEAPLPIPIEDGHGIPPAEFTVIVPFIGQNLLNADREGKPGWPAYLDRIVELQRDVATAETRPHVAVIPIADSDLKGVERGPRVSQLLTKQSIMAITPNSDTQGLYSDRLARDLGQGIIQQLFSDVILQDANHGNIKDKRLQIFISHARMDLDASVSLEMTSKMLNKIQQFLSSNTRLSNFVDTHNIQPGEDWSSSIRANIPNSAILMVRTNHYSSREWTQREILDAKRYDRPIVCLNAISDGEERGSFLLDHIPTVTFPVLPATAVVNIPKTSSGLREPSESLPIESLERLQELAIEQAINRLVDECLKKALWDCQTIYSVTSNNETHKKDGTDSDHRGFDRAPVHAPEPVTLTDFLQEYKEKHRLDSEFWLIHPDPPLLPPEHQVIVEMCKLAGYDRCRTHVVTPRTFLASGGALLQGKNPQLALADIQTERPLKGITVGLSMSISEDLGRLGLHPKHLDLAIAEITQLVLIAGGSLTYASTLGQHEHDLTQRVLLTAERYAQTEAHEQQKKGQGLDPGYKFNILAPCTELVDESVLTRLVATQKQYGASVQIKVLDPEGSIQKLDAAAPWKNKNTKETQSALTRIRQALPEHCDARLIIGGKTLPQSETADGYRGKLPGIIEEARYTVRHKKPLIICAGFGGATSLLAHELDLPGAPKISNKTHEIAKMNPDYMEAIREIADSYERDSINLDDNDLARLVSTNRPSELAYLAVKALTKTTSLK